MCLNRLHQEVPRLSDDEFYTANTYRLSALICGKRCDVEERLNGNVRRKRIQGSGDHVSSVKKTFVNATNSQDAIEPSTKDPVHLNGNNVYYNPAYQSSQPIRKSEDEGYIYNPVYHTANDRKINTVALTPTGNLEHDYAYAGTNDTTGDIERGQVYNPAYRSVGDKDGKPMKARMDAKHEYTYVDNDNGMPFTENGDNQKGQVYNCAYQSVNGTEGRVNGGDIYHYSDSQTNAKSSESRGSGGDEYSYATPLSAVSSSVPEANKEGQVYNTVYHSVECPE